MLVLAIWVAYLGYGGLLSQKDHDQGDTCQRVGLFYSLAKMAGWEKNYRGEPLQVGWKKDLAALSAGNGVYRRSPDPMFWGYRINNLSRDDHSMLMQGMSQMGDINALKETMKAIIDRGFRYQNVAHGTDVPDSVVKQADILGWHDVTQALRGEKLWWTYPLIFIWDFGYFFDLAFREGQGWDYDNMLAIKLMDAAQNYPTLASVLVWHLYKRTDFLAKIKNYYRVDSSYNGIMPLGDLYQEAVEKIVERHWWL